MGDINDFKRKLNNRLFAIENSWKMDGLNNKGIGDGSDEGKWKELENNLLEADATKYFDGNGPISSNGTISGRIKRFVKRVIRKLLNIVLGWYLRPLYQRQSSFNGKILNCVSEERLLLAEMYRTFGDTEVRLTQAEIIIKKQQEQLTQARETIRIQRDLLKRIENLPTDDDEFYHDFEEKFRGSREEIRYRLDGYVPIIKEHFSDWSNTTFVDVGSGRGEWLDILKYNGAKDYIGVDLNETQNGLCEENGHKTVCCDCMDYLEGLPEESVDVITGFQIIEHLYMSDLMRLLKVSYRALKKNGLLLLETPNPRNVVVGSDLFYLDPSHKRPIDMGLMEFLTEWVGFNEIHCIEANADPKWIGVEREPENELDAELLGVVNNLCWHMYGARDYAILAVKGRDDEDEKA